MSELLFFFAFGLGSLALLLHWLLQYSSSSNPKEFSEAREVLTSVRLELPPRALGERIFAPQDWDFLAKSAPLDVQQLFLQERAVLALSWLRQTREKVGRLMDFHRKAVRANVNLSPSVEFRLAFDYLIFLLTYEILYGLIWLRGPYASRKIVSYAAGMAEELSYLSGHILVGLDAARLSRIKQSWSSGSAAN